MINSDDVEIVEENNYYSFGLEHKGYNSNVASTNIALKYKYNGKELNDALGYDVYDYTARHYDPALGRWLQVDPLAEDMTRFSPYNFAFGNPIYYIDPDGMSPLDNYLINEDGSILRQKTDDKTDTFTYVEEDGTKHEIGTYDKNDNGLINLSDISYKSENGEVSVNVTGKPKSRKKGELYISGEALSSVIGASADSGEDIYITRASNSDGSSPGDSTTHIDGKNIDIRFAGKNGSRNSINYKNNKTNFDKIDQSASSTMNASLKKFGYKSIRASTLKIMGNSHNTVFEIEKYSIPGTSHLKDHYDHEHLESYRPNITTRSFAKPVSTIPMQGIKPMQGIRL